MHSNDWLGRREALSPDKVALLDATAPGAPRPITYREWNRGANRTANLLREAAGVRKGDRVAILAKNCVEYLELWFACGKLGAVLQTLNWRLTGVELKGLLEDAAPRVLVYGPEFAELAQSVRGDTHHMIALETPARDDHLALAARDSHADSAPPAVELRDSDPWVICYTGGTTGLPKGAVLTHGSVTANSVNTVMSWGLSADDVAILNAPLFHVGGLNVFTSPLVHAGGTSIVCRAFEPDQMFDLVRDAGVTVFFGVPTMFLALQQHPRWGTANFARLKLVISGGAPCPAPVFDAFFARGVDFKTGYGLTEAGPNTFWLPRAQVRTKAGAVGYPLFHIDVRVIRSDGGDAGVNEPGELLIRGPHVFAGYWNRAGETERVLRNGWLHTGDLARRDEDGCHWIVGRLKDVIISGGENVYPAEVESVMAAHPAVAEVALIGIPDAKWGEVGRAVVRLHDDASAREDELIEFCRARLARYKVPRSVVFVAALPRTGAGKVDKLALRDSHGRE